MAGGQVPQQAGINVLDIVKLLGGDKTVTTGKADTSGLNAVLGQTLNPADPTALLASIFAQAGGQIPGLQAARANAVGARTGGNSGIDASMQKLLGDTVLRAQQQLAQQELSRQQIAANAAGNLAQATRGSTVTSGTNLSKATGVLALAKGLNELGNSPLGQSAVKGVKGLFGAGTDSTAGTTVAQSTPGMESVGMTPAPGSAAYEFNGGQPTQFNIPSFDFTSGAGASAAGSSGSSSGSGVDYSAAGDAVNSFTPEVDQSWADEFANIIGMRDGGHVGTAAAMQAKMQRHQLKGYADGGRVTETRVAGGRKGTGARYEADPITQALAMHFNPLGTSASGAGVGSAASGNTSGATGEGGDPVGNAAPGDISIGQAIGNVANVASGNGMGLVSNAVNNPAISLAIGLLTQNPIAIVNSLISLSNSGSSTLSDPGMSLDSTPGMSVVGPNGEVSSVPNSGISPVADAISQGNADAVATGDSGSSSGGDSAAAPGGGGGSGGGDGSGSGDGSAYRNGGKVKGPGTPTSDSVPAMLSKDEYVIPSDVVDALGVTFFDTLLKLHHTPTRTRSQGNLPAGEAALDTDDKNGDDLG
jgi:hypothetical protein